VHSSDQAQLSTYYADGTLECYLQFELAIKMRLRGDLLIKVASQIVSHLQIKKSLYNKLPVTSKLQKVIFKRDCLTII